MWVRLVRTKDPRSDRGFQKAPETRVLRFDQNECASDVLGDVDPCLFGRGSGPSTPAVAQPEGGLQFAFVKIDLVCDAGYTLLVVEPPSFFEFLGQFD